MASRRRVAGPAPSPSPPKMEASTRHQHSTPLVRRTADASDGRPHRHDRLLPLLFTLREKSGLSGAAQTLDVGGSVQVSVVARDTGGVDVSPCATVVWGSSNPSVSTVSGNWPFTGVAA